MDATSFIDEYYRLWLLLAQTRSAIFKAREKRTGRYMPPNQAAALVFIWGFKGQITPTVLARYFSLERHSISELISRMVASGYITKHRDEKDKKLVRISITPKGRDICIKVMDSEFIRSVMSELTDEQRDQLRTCLQILLKRAREELGIKTVPPMPF
jgi:DNA-binding MarR family transcriptional regulator